jgi:exodeoxyribonuclease VII large subunit
MTILGRRFPSVILEVVPVKVQGDKSDLEISAALKMLNDRGLSDVIIIARGGGSLEDLAAFNSESVARAVFSSGIPVVSAVGHETDYTICDFVADLRAPTPSAAAELVVPVKKELEIEILKLKSLLTDKMYSRIEKQRHRLHLAAQKLVDPKRKIIDMRLKLDDFTQRLARTVHTTVEYRKDRLAWKNEKLLFFSPLKKNNDYSIKIGRLNGELINRMNSVLNIAKLRQNELTSKLEALSPLSILKRGYSVTRTVPESRIITGTDGLTINQDLEIILARGSVRVGIKGIIDHGEEEF